MKSYSWGDVMKLFAAALVVCVWAVIFVIASIISWFDSEDP
jgi:hypothetical protein